MRQLQQQGLGRREQRQIKAACRAVPAVAIRLAARIALDAEMLADDIQMPLNGAQIAFETGIGQTAVQLRAGDEAALRDAPQNFQNQHRIFQCSRARG